MHGQVEGGVVILYCCDVALNGDLSVQLFLDFAG